MTQAQRDSGVTSVELRQRWSA